MGYMNVTMEGIRTHTSYPERSQFLQKFWKWYGGAWNEFKEDFGDCTKYGITSIAVAIITFLLGPIYFLSNFVTLFFPAFIVLYLYFGYDTDIWMTNDIDLFQVIMISVYLVLCCILSILFVWNCSE